jgi:hypothetical protein
VCVQASWVLPPTPATPPAPAAAPTADRAEIAVFPIQDGVLFRAERAELRLLLASQLARLAPDHAILPLAEVDAKLRPVSKTTGARCAFDGEPAERRAREQGWTVTELMHVLGTQGKPEELWVQTHGWDDAESATWTALWDSRLDVADRYRVAFFALTRQQDGGGLVGGIVTSGSNQGALREGPVTVCETKRWSACADSSAWKDGAGGLAACFAGEDDVTTEVLVRSDGPAPRCEIAQLDAAEGRWGQREACLCRALTASAAFRAKPGRRTVRVRFEAPDLAGKPRPELRVLEATTNLHAEDDRHVPRTGREVKAGGESVHRLVVDNVDALAAPLARCATPSNRLAVADIDVQEHGAVSGARLVTDLASKDAAACVEKALGRAAFACTSDGKAAKVRIAAAWPEAAP